MANKKAQLGSCRTAVLSRWFYTTRLMMRLNVR
jgi:hypothetical protein